MVLRRPAPPPADPPPILPPDIAQASAEGSLGPLQPSVGSKRRSTDKALASAGITESANRGKLPFAAQAEFGEGYGRIVEQVFDLPDPMVEYEALERALAAGNRDTDSLSQALDQAESCARRAHRLYVNAKVDYERFSIDADAVEGAMWDEAVAQLSTEKERGLRTKQVTDSDVRKRVAVLYPDEWRDAQLRRAKGEQAVKHLERFADLWMGRVRTLAALLARR